MCWSDSEIFPYDIFDPLANLPLITRNSDPHQSHIQARATPDFSNSNFDELYKHYNEPSPVVAVLEDKSKYTVIPTTPGTAKFPQLALQKLLNHKDSDVSPTDTKTATYSNELAHLPVTKTFSLYLEFEDANMNKIVVMNRHDQEVYLHKRSHGGDPVVCLGEKTIENDSLKFEFEEVTLKVIEKMVREEMNKMSRQKISKFQNLTFTDRETNEKVSTMEFNCQHFTKYHIRVTLKHDILVSVNAGEKEYSFPADVEASELLDEDEHVQMAFLRCACKKFIYSVYKF